jgi:hypothetical protein
MALRARATRLCEGVLVELFEALPCQSGRERKTSKTSPTIRHLPQAPVTIDDGLRPSVSPSKVRWYERSLATSLRSLRARLHGCVVMSPSFITNNQEQFTLYVKCFRSLTLSLLTSLALRPKPAAFLSSHDLHHHNQASFDLGNDC